MGKEELIDVLDENGVKLGKVLTRREVHRGGLWHRAIVVAVVNDKNQILLQKRSATKDKNPNMWDISVAGHISAGQDALSAAAREINEEVSINLGFHIDIKDFRYMYSFRKEQVFSENYIERQFYDFFILRKSDIDISNICLQLSEVSEVKFVEISELIRMIENGEMVERGEVYTELTNHLFRV